jgi:hypothetical protein
MSIKGKIALIVVLPIYVGVITAGFLLALILYGFGIILEYSGIGEAFEYLGKKIKAESVKYKFRSILKKEGIE